MEDLLDLVGTADDDIAEPVKKKVIETFHLFMKTVKAKLVYPSSSRLPQQFKEELFAAITGLVDELGSLSFKVETDRILYESLEVYRAHNKAENFAHTFFRDGILSFQFKKGIHLEELESFIDIISRMMRSAFVDDDLATLLWESGFEHVAYKLMDDILDIETFEYGTDSVKSGASPSKTDLQNLYENEINLDISEEDFEVDHEKSKSRSTPYLDIPDAAAEFIKRVATYDETEKQAMTEMLAADTALDCKDYVINLLFEILGLETDNVGFNEALELIAKVRDDFLKAGDFTAAITVFNRTKELELGLKNLKDPKLDRIHGFIEGFASSDKIKIIADTLNQQKDLNYPEVIEYLKMLPWQAISPLLGALGELVHFPARRAVCQALEVLAADRTDILATGIEDPRWYVVRNVVMILGHINKPKALTYLRRTIRHPDLRVRKETVISAAKVTGEEAKDFLIVALADEDERLQMLALKELVKHKIAKAYPKIEKIVMDKKFKDRSTDQIREFLEALAEIGGDKAFDLLKGMATKSSLIPSEKQERVRHYAVRALGLVQTREATRLLERIAKQRNHNLADAALRALNKKFKGE